MLRKLGRFERKARKFTEIDRKNFKFEKNKESYEN